jgi:hypothetical protein
MNKMSESEFTELKNCQDVKIAEYKPGGVGHK